MKKFSDLGIAAPEPAFVGDKIKMHKILGKNITVHKYVIEPSKFTDKGNGNRLKMQLSVDNIKRIIFTGSSGLMCAIEEVKKEDFPFQTTIIQLDTEQLLFT